MSDSMILPQQGTIQRVQWAQLVFTIITLITAMKTKKKRINSIIL